MKNYLKDAGQDKLCRVYGAWLASPPIGALALLSYKRRKQILSNNLTEMRDLGKEDYPYQ